jgi:hypothetical protein
VAYFAVPPLSPLGRAEPEPALPSCVGAPVPPGLPDGAPVAEGALPPEGPAAGGPLPVVPIIGDVLGSEVPLVGSLGVACGLVFGSDGALAPLSSTGATARAVTGAASAAAITAMARYGTGRLDISSFLAARAAMPF